MARFKSVKKLKAMAGTDVRIRIRRPVIRIRIEEAGIRRIVRITTGQQSPYQFTTFKEL